jgi:hypothetical protein
VKQTRGILYRDENGARTRFRDGNDSVPDFAARDSHHSRRSHYVHDRAKDGCCFSRNKNEGGALIAQQMGWAEDRSSAEVRYEGRSDRSEVNVQSFKVKNAQA